MKQIFRFRSFQLISLNWFESFCVSGSQIQMRSFQLIILLIMVYHILDRCLLEVAAFIYSFLGESGSDHVEFTEMSAAVAILTAAIFLIVMKEVVIFEMLCCVVEEIVLSLTLLFVVFQIMHLGSFVQWVIVIGRLCKHFVSTFVFNLKNWSFSRGNTI